VIAYSCWLELKIQIGKGAEPLTSPIRPFLRAAPVIAPKAAPGPLALLVPGVRHDEVKKISSKLSLCPELFQSTTCLG
jgi:hypothetical protein